MYMACVVICNTVSGGHLNPAITFAVWLTCDNKKAKISKPMASNQYWFAILDVRFEKYGNDEMNRPASTKAKVKNRVSFT